MRLSTKLTGIVALGGAAALAAGLISSGGIGAAFTDEATATADINVGTMNCILETTDQDHVKIHNSTQKHTATITLDKVLASTGSQTVPLTVKNTGDMPVTTTWTSTGGDAKMVPSDAPSGTILAVNGTQDVQVGFNWTDLGNNYMGWSTTATFTVTCGEAPALRLFTDVNGSASWTNGSVVLTTDGTNGSSAGLSLTNVPAALPSEPNYVDAAYSAGNARMVIHFINGTYVMSAAPLATTPVTRQWDIPKDTSSGPVTGWNHGVWADVLAAYSGVAVSKVEVLVDFATTNDHTISCVNYGGIVFGTTC